MSRTLRASALPRFMPSSSMSEQYTSQAGSPSSSETESHPCRYMEVVTKVGSIREMYPKDSFAFGIISSVSLYAWCTR